jgi:segregation and condensation protein B
VKASQIVESVLYASDAPLKAEEIARADESLDEDRVEEAIQELRTLYDESERSFQVLELGEGYQILTRPEFAPYLERFDTVPRPSRLSGPALETLAIIAYRQPIGRVEVEYIRGVGSAGVIRTLQDRGLIEVLGRGEGLGRPLLYGTTRRFLTHFGFASLDELPRPEELPVVLRDRRPLEELEEGESERRDPGQGELGLEENGERSEPVDEAGGEARDDVGEGSGNGAGPEAGGWSGEGARGEGGEGTGNDERDEERGGATDDAEDEGEKADKEVDRKEETDA